MHEDDDDLLAGLRAGDDGAFRLLVDRHADRLLGLAHALLGNRGDAEDAVQETFLGAFRGVGRFAARSSLRTWLSGILVRQASKVRRRPAARRERTGLPSGEGEGAVGGEPAADGRVEQEVAARIDLLAMLDALAPDHRQVLVLRELEGLSYDEIAAVLGVPRGTVESRLFRARAKLVELFPGYGGANR